MTTFNDDPNFSVVMPGGCNAACSFCFAKDKKTYSASMADYVGGLVSALASMPSAFYQISITGGEPMLSPYIMPVLAAIFPFKKRYHNILLTTNGTDLERYFDIVSMTVDHINISRHHWDEGKNKAIFGGTYDVFDEDIVRIIDKYSESGIDVSANCVINDATDREFIEKYILWARGIGFHAVRFRKENGSLEKTPVEKTYDAHKVVHEGKCPVCRTTKQIIHGFDVYWKSSILEPSEKISDVFEVVYAPDGKMYLDWAYKKPLIDKAKPAEKKRETRGVISSVPSTSCGGSSSCGSSGCGGVSRSSSRC